MLSWVLPRMPRPSLKRSHPGFYAVTLSFVVVHALLALDLLLPGTQQRHSVGIWIGIKQIAPLMTWGEIHVFCAVVFIIALYRGAAWLHFGFRFSCVVLWALTGSYVYAAFQPHAAFAGAALTAGMALIATRASVEPFHVIPADVVDRNAAEALLLERRRHTVR